MASVTKFVGTASSVAADGTFVWTNPTNVTADDGSFATASNGGVAGWTEELFSTMSGNEFAIPAGSRIDGIEVAFQAKTDGGSGTVYATRLVMLVVGGVRTGLDLRKGEAVNPTETVYSHGASTTTWGVSLTVAAVNASDFGVTLQFERPATTTRTLQVDYVQITVHYTEGAGDIEYDADCKFALCMGQPPNRAVAETYRFVFPGFGTPKAVLLFQAGNVISTSRATQGEVTTTVDGIEFTMGSGVSATNRASAMFRMTDATGTFTSVLNRVLTKTRVLEGDGEAHDFSAFGTDYFEIDCEDAVGGSGLDDGGGHVIALAIGGTGVSAGHVAADGMDGTINEELDVSTFSFEPGVLINLSGMELYPSGGHSVYGGQTIGFARNPGTGDANVTQVCAYQGPTVKGVLPTTPNLADTQMNVRVSTDRLHYNPDWARPEGGTPPLEYSMTCKTFDSSGFTLRSSGGNGSDDDGLAVTGLALPAGWDSCVGTITTPTATGSKAFSDGDFSNTFSFTPKLLIIVWTKAQSVDSLLQDTADGESVAITIATPHRQFSISHNGLQAAATTDLQQLISRRFVDCNDGDKTDLFVADWTSMDAGGFTVNFSATDGTARKGIFLAIGEEGGGGGTILPQIMQHYHSGIA